MQSFLKCCTLLLTLGATRIPDVQEALLGCSSRAQCEGQGLPGQWYLGMAVVVTMALNSALPCLGLGQNDAGGTP